MRCWMDFPPPQIISHCWGPFSWFGSGPQKPTDRPWSKALQSFKNLDIITDIVYWSLIYSHENSQKLMASCTVMSASIQAHIRWFGFVVRGEYFNLHTPTSLTNKTFIGGQEFPSVCGNWLSDGTPYGPPFWVRNNDPVFHHNYRDQKYISVSQTHPSILLIII